MSDMLSISSTAVAAYQRALSTVSNNIANVSTDGYSRQDVALESNSPAKVASYYMGTGVAFGSVKRQFDEFAEANLRKSTSDLLSQQPVVDYTQRVMDIMGDKSVGLSSALDQFFESARSLSVDPASTVQRASFLRSAQGLASRFAELSGQLDLIGTETQQALEGAAGQFNTLTDQLALVNVQLNKAAKLENQPSELLDRRDLLLRQLSEFAGLKTSFEVNGVVTVSLGSNVNQSKVVDKLVARPIGIDTSNGKFDFVLDPYGTTESLPGINSGQMGGLTNFMSQVLEPAQKSLNYLAKTLVKEVNAIQANGIDGYGQVGQDMFRLDPNAPNEAAGIKVALSDAMRIATAAQFRISESVSNSSTVKASLTYTPTDTPPGISNPLLGNNPNPAAGVPVKVEGVKIYAPVTTVAAGIDKPTFYLDNATGAQQLQIMTRDGRHLLGRELTLDEQFQLISPSNGFAPDTTYSEAYLNKSGEYGYRNMNVLYGAKATVQYQQMFDKNGVPAQSIPVPAVLETGRVTSVQTGTLIGNGDIVINGYSLGPLTLKGNETDMAQTVADWIGKANLPDLKVEAFNDITIDPTKLKIDQPLQINSVAIGPFTNFKSLVKAIQDKSDLTGVTARIGSRGELLLENLPSAGGLAIHIGTSDPVRYPENALGIDSQTLNGKIRISRTLDPNSPQTSDISISFGPNGTPAALAKIGIRTGAYIEGKVPDDLLVFVTGEGGSATVATSYAGQPLPPQENLRQQSLELRFTAANRYVIVDNKTGSELAERIYDPTVLEPVIEYHGLSIKLNFSPNIGDSFLIDGNLDGIGNNENMLLMTDLAKKPIIEGKTLSNTYIDQVNDIGNLAQQAKITQQALTVVNEQAIQSRDSASGVNLDDEAAELIRFQQAYQASAKAMQVSSQLFDSILQVR
jgi:flagellar hook-associated protein FlgK